MSTFYSIIGGFVELGDSVDDQLAPNVHLDIDNWLW
jgi:hypothetical protein